MFSLSPCQASSSGSSGIVVESLYGRNQIPVASIPIDLETANCIRLQNSRCTGTCAIRVNVLNVLYSNLFRFSVELCLNLMRRILNARDSSST